MIHRKVAGLKTRFEVDLARVQVGLGSTLDGDIASLQGELSFHRIHRER